MSVVWEKCVVGEMKGRGTPPHGGAGGTTKGSPWMSKVSAWRGAQGGRAPGCPPQPGHPGVPRHSALVPQRRLHVARPRPGPDTPALSTGGPYTLQHLPRRAEVPPDVCLTWGLCPRATSPGPEPSPGLRP